MQPSEIETDVNVFDQGLDSLIATQLRNRWVLKFSSQATVSKPNII
jgi:aryl carrier-like protein